MKHIFFNRFFHPDSSATSQMLSDLAFHWAAAGRDVHVVTSRIPGSDSPGEVVNGVTVHRVAAPSEGPHGLAQRAFAYAAYSLGARRAAMSLVSPGDVVIVKTDPPLLAPVLAHLAKGRGAHVVAWLQDLFPEVAVEYGVPGMRGPVAAMLRRMRDRSLARMDAVVAIGDAMASRVRDLGCVAPERVHVIHNWADGRAIAPLAPEANALRRAWNPGGAFLVAYSGNLGRVHEFDTLLGAAALLAADPGIRFVVVGRGPRLADVKARARRMGLANLRFEPHQDRSVLAQSLGAADVHLAVLRPAFEGLVLPSKLYGIMAAGRPTIFVGSVTGETGRILAETGAGLAVATGDAEGLAAAIRRLRDDASLCAAMGARARKALEERYDMALAFARWDAVIAPYCRKFGSADAASEG
ncbi:MAG TPA: glycosyltransferase family 4 protein [Usitatibacter sp.]|nr:glycosyltransferase family 4 protein [Usitatibacter sp.]